MLTNYKRQHPIPIYMPDGAAVPAVGIGDYVFGDASRPNSITDVLHVPDLQQSLLSVTQLYDQGYSLAFSPSGCTIQDSTGNQVLSGFRSDGHYLIPVTSASALSVRLSAAQLWHARLGHPGRHALPDLLQVTRGIKLPKSACDTGFCPVCAQGKQSRTPYPTHGGPRAEAPLKLVHSDHCGPTNTPTISGKS